MEKDHHNGSLMPGIILITVGVAFLLPKLHILKSADIWPLFILAPGLGFLVMYANARDRQKSAGLLIPGTITTLLGLFFFYLNFTDWSQMEFLWPIFPLIVGVAFYIFYFALGRTQYDRGILIPATILTLIGLFFLVFARFSYNLWPIMLIVAGLWMLFARTNHHRHDNDPDQ